MDRKLMRMVSLGTLVIVLLVSGLAHSYPVLASTVSTTHHVAPSGQNTAGCGSQTEPCRTIQYAVNQAVSGDTIRVAAGTYTFESDTDVCTGRIGGTSAVVCYFDKELTILGGFAPSSWTRQNVVANPTIIDGQGVWRAVRLQKSYPTAPTASLNMAGFTIRNGYAVGRSSGSADATNSFGGGLLSEHASVTLADMVFVDNRSQGGSTTGVGGAGAGGAVAVNTTWGGVSAVLHSISFENNQAIGGSGGIRGGHGIGGALFTYGITFRGEGITFKDNRAAAGNSTAGSGVGDGERADGQGAAAAFHGASVAALYDVTATNNTTQGGSAPAGEAGGAFGGAFFVEDSSLAIYDSQVRNNTALGGNGRNPTNVAGQAWGGGICSMNANLTVSRVEVVSNRAQGGDGVVYGGAVSGGGIAVVSVTTARRSVVVNNTIVAANYAGVGQGRLVGGGGGGV